MSIPVLLADDHQIVRDGLRVLLEKEDDLDVIATAETGREAVELAAKLNPKVIVMDISMPDLNGIEATRKILAANKEMKVIALSMHSDRRFVAGVLSAGASGYLLKDSAYEDLVDAIRAVLAGRTYLGPRVAEVVVEDYVERLSMNNSAPASELTEREREVLQLLAEGNSTKQIAAELHISVKTVETHRMKIMEKLDIHNVAELTKYALREGLTSLEN